MGYITEKKTVEIKIEVLPCVKCGGDDIEIDDCGYSSFNVAWGKCKKCKNREEFTCVHSISKSKIAKVWNKANDPEILRADYLSQIKVLKKKISKLPVPKDVNGSCICEEIAKGNISSGVCHKHHTEWI